MKLNLSDFFLVNSVALSYIWSHFLTQVCKDLPLCLALIFRSMISFELIFLKYILLIMLLQFSHFFSPLFPSALHHPPTLSSCPWVVHVSSLVSPFPILLLTSPCLFCTYLLCFLFPVPFPHILLPLITLHVISISVNLFLF